MTKTFKFGALAAALTMAFAAQAAEVTLYGSVSTGLVYKHTNATLKEGQSKNSYGMESVELPHPLGPGKRRQTDQ